MPGEVRVGVIGTSWWADDMHLPSIKSHPQARLAAICGRNRERAEEMAAKYDIPLVYTDYREMIAKGGLDAAVISTPDDLHYPITMAALDAGLPPCTQPMIPPCWSSSLLTAHTARSRSAGWPRSRITAKSSTSSCTARPARSSPSSTLTA